VILGEPFPASAIAGTDTVLIRLGREPFLKLLNAYPGELLRITEALSRNLHYKSLIGKGLVAQAPEERIKTLLRLLKKESGCPENDKYRLNLSRQQIADMIGLRVETVIRAVKKLEENGLVEIRHGKVFY
jgi:CRP-like cAMP-binding protein